MNFSFKIAALALTFVSGTFQSFAEPKNDSLYENNADNYTRTSLRIYPFGGSLEDDYNRFFSVTGETMVGKQLRPYLSFESAYSNQQSESFASQKLQPVGGTHSSRRFEAGFTWYPVTWDYMAPIGRFIFEPYKTMGRTAKQKCMLGLTLGIEYSSILSGVDRDLNGRFNARNTVTDSVVSIYQLQDISQNVAPILRNDAVFHFGVNFRMITKLTTSFRKGKKAHHSFIREFYLDILKQPTLNFSDIVVTPSMAAHGVDAGNYSVLLDKFWQRKWGFKTGYNVRSTRGAGLTYGAEFGYRTGVYTTDFVDFIYLSAKVGFCINSKKYVHLKNPTEFPKYIEEKKVEEKNEEPAPKQFSL